MLVTGTSHGTSLHFASSAAGHRDSGATVHRWMRPGPQSRHVEELPSSHCVKGLQTGMLCNVTEMQDICIGVRSPDSAPGAPVQCLTHNTHEMVNMMPRSFTLPKSTVRLMEGAVFRGPDYVTAWLCLQTELGKQEAGGGRVTTDPTSPLWPPFHPQGRPSGRCVPVHPAPRVKYAWPQRQRAATAPHRGAACAGTHHVLRCRAFPTSFQR